MKEEKKAKGNQYHPSVCAGLRIALDEDSEYLTFEEEHQLGTGSKSIDCLIIKKDSQICIKKDIGRIFRGHNIVEIKGKGDYLSIDSFYRALGYAFFYKSDGAKENSIDIKDITITFITPGMPIKLLKHLKRVWEIECIQNGEGIYYLEGFTIPIQLIVASKLDEEDNLLLKSLLTPVKEREKINRLLNIYKQHKDNGYYKKAMNFIVQKEEKNIRRIENMCDALDKLVSELADERVEKMLEERVAQVLEQRVEQVLEERVEQVLEERVEQIEAEIKRQMEEQIKKQMALNMLEDNLAIEAVSKYTGFSSERVIKLKQGCN